MARSHEPNSLSPMATTPSSSRRRAVPDEITYPDTLPIVAWRDELLDAISTNQVVIVAGETGSGKSTQLPKLCLELGRGVDGRIGHTQPRRIAARAIAERVAEELGVAVGGLVGYTVRFTDDVSPETAIKVMTDGILLNEIQRDPDLRQYDTIIVDEAHERSLNIDFLLGHLAQLRHRRPDLRIIVTSATIDTERFAAHFDGAPVVEVEGRTYPVEVRYRPLIEPDAEPRDQSQAICDAVDELIAEVDGDILVFCSGEREIRDAVDALSDRNLRFTEILPLYGRLSAAEQHRVFSRHTGRRIVVSTNVAETSLTVPGIRAVVDSGMARVSRFNRRTKVQQLPIEPISQASARQRAGRCGRIGPGICVRLYTQDDLDSRPEYTDPEILRTSLASVMLQMASAGLGDMASFPFIDPPDTRSVKDGVNLLRELRAITDGTPGSRDWLTPIGRRLARLPLDPRLGRMLLAANDNACLDEVLTIVSALAIQDPRERPTDKEQQADERHRRFADERSDFLSWLKLWAFVSQQRDELTSSQFRRMCRREFLSWRRVREWQDIRAQLRRATRDMRMHPNRKPAPPDLVHESLLSGLLSHVGRKQPDGWEYRGPRGSTFAIRPGSVLFKRGPEWVMAAELIETTRTWATGVAATDPDTIERVGEHLIRRSVSEPWWDRDRGAAVARVTATLYGIPVTTDKITLYARVDPGIARHMFIEHALVHGEWETHHDFAERNADAINAVLDMETRERRSDLLVPDDAIAAWFDARIPGEVTSVATFDRWWRDQRSETPHALDLSEADLIDAAAAPIDLEAYPPVWHHGDLDLELDYEFDSHSPTDGLTITLPLAALDRVDPAVFEWNVPGLRIELVTSLLRSLPKPLRKELSPIADAAVEITRDLDPGSGRVDEAVARSLTRRTGSIVRPDDFDPERIPHHVRPHYRVVDADGTVVAEGDDLDEIRRQLRAAAASTIAEASHPLERSGITDWDFGTLPSAVEVGEPGRSVTVFPTIVDDQTSVSIRLLGTRDDQAREMWRGLRRLVRLQLPSTRRLLRSVLDVHGPVPIAGSPYRDRDEWMEDCLTCALDLTMAELGGAWDQAAFETLVDQVRSGLADAVERVGFASAAVLDALEDANAAIADTPDAAFADILEDVDDQLDRIVFPGFLTAVGAERLDDLRRYLEAVAYRLRRLPEDPARDRERMATVAALEDEHDQLSEVLSWTPELVDIAWMLQELRVSLFAQPVGARGPVSEKRIRSALDALLST